MFTSLSNVPYWNRGYFHSSAGTKIVLRYQRQDYFQLNVYLAYCGLAGQIDGRLATQDKVCRTPYRWKQGSSILIMLSWVGNMNLPSLFDIVNGIKHKARAYSDDHTKKLNACLFCNTSTQLQ